MNATEREKLEREFMNQAKPGEWKLVKNCDCEGPSKPGAEAVESIADFGNLLPVCSLCGTRWKIIGRFGTHPKQKLKLIL